MTDAEDVDTAKQVLSDSGKVVPVFNNPALVALIPHVFEASLGRCDLCHADSLTQIKKL